MQYFFLQIIPLISLVLFACQENEKPRLAVVLVIDQMRADYLEKFHSEFGEGGFKRLQSEGIQFNNHFISYANTETGPGHAVVLSGLLPKSSGIVKNAWYKEGTEEKVYCVKGGPEDVVLPSHGEKKVGQENKLKATASPVQFKGRTVGDYLISQYQGAKVFSVSNKDRSAILMGGKNPTGVFWPDKKTYHMTSSAYYFQKLPEWVVQWNASHSMNSDTTISWDVIDRSQHSLGDSFGKVYPRDKNWMGTFPYNISHSMFKYSHLQTQRHYDFIKALIEKEELGNDKQPDILAWSISSTDHMGHLFGMESKELRETYRHIDKIISDFLNYLDIKIGKNQYTVFLTSDHGVRHTVEWERSQGNKKAFRIDNSKITREIIEKLRLDFSIPKDSNINAVFRIFRIRGNNVYINKKLTDSLNIPFKPLREKLKVYIEKISGVAQVVDLREELGTDSFSKAVKENFYPSRMGEFMIRIDPQGNFLGPLGKHGYYDPDCTHIPLLIRLPGGARKIVETPTRLADLAPTLAEYLNIRLETPVDGQVIEEVLVGMK